MSRIAELFASVLYVTCSSIIVGIIALALYLGLYVAAVQLLSN